MMNTRNYFAYTIEVSANTIVLFVFIKKLKCSFNFSSRKTLCSRSVGSSYHPPTHIHIPRYFLAVFTTLSRNRIVKKWPSQRSTFCQASIPMVSKIECFIFRNVSFFCEIKMRKSGHGWHSTIFVESRFYGKKNRTRPLQDAKCPLGPVFIVSIR